MMVVEFMKNLEDRYSNIPEAVGNDILYLVKDISDSDRQSLWENFLNSYAYNSPPKRATFYKLMYESGIKVARRDDTVFFEFCPTCNVGYTTNVPACIYCGGELNLHASDRYPARFVTMHDGCDRCERFDAEEAIGPKCDKWGSSNEEWKLEGPELERQRKLCRACQCKVCCRAERIYRADYSMYKEMEDRGDFKDGFIPKK
jgi:hypothetical protein